MTLKTSDAAPAAPPLGAEALHELRNRLSQVIGYAELLIEQSGEGTESRLLEDLKRIGFAGRQALDLVNDRSLAHKRPNEVASPAHPAVVRNDVGVNVTSLILVVDDNEMNRDVLSRRLEQLGHEVSKVGNGLEALRALRSQEFDLVLLDIMMPEMDGYAVLGEMKNDEVLRNVPVIMISALDQLETVVRCIEMGAEDYLLKPFEPTLLKARVRACLEKKRAHDREISLFVKTESDFKRLKELDRLREDLTQMIVHDLRTPLTSVIAGLQTLESMGDLEESQREILTISSDGAATLLDMINSLLDVERMEAGSMPLEFKHVAAPDLVTHALSQVRQLATNREMSLTPVIGSGLPEFWGDENKLLRVLVNLIGNAIKFTPAGGNISIAVRKTEDSSSLLFSVTDTGEGIPTEAFERIFEKFGQVESRKAGRKMSTGLGLTFCKLVVQAHGGKISVVSVLGEGSTFSFTIPIQSTVAAPETQIAIT
jgi:two-component system sensor histidine kinase/response regulator